MAASPVQARKRSAGFAGLRRAARQRLEKLAATVPRLGAFGHRIHDLDAIAGGEIDDLGGAEGVTQRGQTRRDVGLGNGERGDLVRADVAIGRACDADLVHPAMGPEGAAGVVTEASRPRWSRDAGRETCGLAAAAAGQCRQDDAGHEADPQRPGGRPIGLGLDTVLERAPL